MRTSFLPISSWLMLGSFAAMAGCSSSSDGGVACSPDDPNSSCDPVQVEPSEGTHGVSTDGQRDSDRNAAATGGTISEVQLPEGEVSYQRDVRPLLETNCVECHRAGGIGPFSFESFDLVEQAGPLIVASVLDGRMPPWPANDSCHAIADSRALSAAEKGVFAAWRDGGYLEGEEKGYAPPERPEVGS